MASAQPSTSSNKLEVKTNKETMRILTRVYQKFDAERRKLIARLVPTDNYSTRAAVRYTGLHIDVLQQLTANDLVIKDVLEIDRSVIHDQMLHFILYDNKFPTTYELFNTLHGKIPPYVDIKTLRKRLVQMGYMWKHIPKYTLVVIEDPKVTYERYYYLKNITQYREENRTIYFVNENILREHPKPAGGFFNLNEKVTLASGDYFEYVTYAMSRRGIHFLNISPDFEEDTFEDWVEGSLARLPSPSVIVLQSSEYNSRVVIPVPNQNSLKVEMHEWLDHHSIPYSVDMSKVELYTLIENYTDTSEKLYKVDNILKLQGHVVLRLPQSIDHLSPGRFMHELIKKNFPAAFIPEAENWRSFLQKIIESVPAATIEKFYNFIAAEEKEMLINDKKVDQIFDYLVKSMENFKCGEQDEDSDLPTFSDSE